MAPGLEPSAANLPDETELTRWATALFNALPGADGFGRGTSLHGVDSGASAAREAKELGPLTPLPVSPGGIGLSPGDIPSQVHRVEQLPAAASGGGAPGEGLPPGWISGIEPVLPGSAPLGGIGAMPTGLGAASAPSAEGVAPGYGSGLDPVIPGTASLGGIGVTPSGAGAPSVPAPGGLPGAWSIPALSDFSPNSQIPDLQSVLRAPTAAGDLYVIAESQSRGLESDPSPPDVGSDALGLEPLWTDAESLIVSPAPRSASQAGNVEPASALAGGGYPAFDVLAVRRDFPILSERIHGRPLVWLDNGATTQKPQAVIDRLAHFYAHENSNVHRGAHTLAARATDAYENARKTVARFLGASSADEIVFVRGSTEAINLVAKAWGRQNVGEGDEIVVSHLEHHANIVPWQQLAAERGARLRVIPVDDRGQILLSEYQRLLSDRTKIVAITHVSNALGTVVPIETVTALAHAAGAKVLIDGAQSVAHTRVNVQAIDADFFVFSGHKIFGPTGIGVLHGKREVLDAMPPWQGGGNMIADVTFERTLYQAAPARFEAGTGNLADAVGLGAALDYLERLGLENIARYEHDLLAYATQALLAVPSLRLIGTAPEKASVLSFLLDGFQPEEVGSALDQYGIAVRAGHHCAQPILRRFGLEGTVRASLALYNTRDEIDALVQALRQISASRGRSAH